MQHQNLGPTKNITQTAVINIVFQFSLKLLHRIPGTKKELKRFKITPDDDCFFSKGPINQMHRYASSFEFPSFNQPQWVLPSELSLLRYEFLL